MQGLQEALIALGAAVLAAITGVIAGYARKWAEKIAAHIDAALEQALLTMQRRVAEAASRSAGAMIAEHGPTVSREHITAEAHRLHEVFAQTAAKHGIDQATIARMIIGELGRIGGRVQ